MSVRSFSPWKRDEEVHKKRGPINRANSTEPPENKNSKTQRRKRNLPDHKLRPH